MEPGQLLQRMVTACEPFSCAPGDSDEARARKAQFSLAMTLIIPAGIVWSIIYALAGDRLAALMPLTYALVSAASLLIMRRARRFTLYQRTELALIILLPLALQLALGGYVGGSAVVVWAFLGPLFAVLFTSAREATVWFGLFLAAVVIAGIAQPSLDIDNALPNWLILVFFVMNLGTVSCIAFAILVSFVRARDRLRSLEVAYLEQTVMLRQREKLATLGTLAAGVAHELNNPAAAVRRAAEQLQPVLDDLRKSALLAVGQHEMTGARADGVLARVDAGPASLTPLQIADAEADVEDWLVHRGVAEPWEVATTLVSLGLSPTDLDALVAGMPPAAVPAAVSSLSKGQVALGLAGVVTDGARRISDIVGALRSYSYLDRGTIQHVDITEGIESTIVLLQSQLRDITVNRDYHDDVPQIAARGNELNQVWTNLISNAVDAGADSIVVRTCPTADADHVIVEVMDNGAGMDSAVADRVFDPFFTTKPPGQGTGLGLSISHNIVVRQHAGEMSVTSEPGRTTFRVVLPVTGATDARATDARATDAGDADASALGQ